MLRRSVIFVDSEEAGEQLAEVALNGAARSVAYLNCQRFDGF